jgi:hypothetical protein
MKYSQLEKQRFNTTTPAQSEFEMDTTEIEPRRRMKTVKNPSTMSASPAKKVVKKK